MTEKNWDGHTERRSPEWVDAVVKQTLRSLGFDMRDTSAIQKDILHLRRSRELCELLQNTVVRITLACVITGTIGAAWAGFTLAVKETAERKTTVIYKTEGTEE